MAGLQSERLRSMGTASIPRLILTFSVPAIISMSVEALYNIIDRYFVGIGVGYLGIAGITLCFPISIFIMAMSMIVGIGGNILFAIRLGEKKYTQAEIILNNSFVLLILMAIVAFVCGQLFMEPLLRSFGASDETLPYAEDYMRILLFGAIFSTITPGMNHFIRSMGHPKTAMFRTLIGTGMNIILGWLFILKFHWGVRGAALATVISQCAASIFVMSFFLQKETPIKICRRYMKLKMPFVRRIFILGLPPSVMQLCNSLMNVILNRSLSYYGNQSLYGGDMAISAFGIINGIALMMIMPMMGFVQGIQPIIGYNYGAHNFDRVRKTLKLALLYSITFMCGTWCLVQWEASWLVSFFSKDNEPLMTLASKSIRVFLLGLPMIAIGMICGNFFQGIGKPGRSLILNMSRQVLILIPLLLIIPRFLGLEGVFMAAPVADTAAASLSIFLLIPELRRMRMLEASQKVK